MTRESTLHARSKYADLGGVVELRRVAITGIEVGQRLVHLCVASIRSEEHDMMRAL